MATYAEFQDAFASTSDRNIKIAARSGKEYWVHIDQLPSIGEPNPLFYGVPVKPHPRAKNDVVWMAPTNVTIK